MVFKLLVTDVDGTLLDNDSRLPDLNKKAIIDCINAGIKVIIATGKTFYSVERYLKEFELKLPQITLGGAVTITPDKKIINDVKIPEDIFHELIDMVGTFGCEPLIDTVDGKIYCQEITRHMSYSTDRGEKIIKIKNIRDEIFSKRAAVISLPIDSEDPLDGYIRKEFESRVRIVRSGKYLLDILNLKASKGNALKNLIQILKISKDEVISFGDSQNDISLFEESGFRIAVKNSCPDLIAIADKVTDNNSDSGLGKAIYKYVL
jgi:Cof subfamily protein (haloacid dehalogenase superfamily)